MVRNDLGSIVHFVLSGYHDFMQDIQA